MEEIASFTFATWGPEQADRYLADFEDIFELLAKMPAIGRLSDATLKHRRRFEHASHVIFYREVKAGIQIRRVLHKRMLYPLHLP